ncbi:MAG: RNA methyltransferase [Pirellulaceae bacterium]|nr:RNA methyltransferase [Planctomycetales bacterium]
MITSLQNSKVKEIVRLRDRKHRQRTGQFVIDGRREVERAIDAQVALTAVFRCIRADADQSHTDLIARCDERVEVIDVNDAVWRKICYGDRKDGILAVAKQPDHGWNTLRQLPDRALIIVLERLEKPGNLGAVLRSVDGAGADGVILADCVCDLYNPNTIRASSGTLFSLPTVVSDEDATREFLAKSGFTIYAAMVDGSRIYSQVDLTGRVAIVLGNEAHGLTKRWERNNIAGIRIPMLGIADSLNVSNTAAILLYEARRQRGT